MAAIYDEEEIKYVLNNLYKNSRSRKSYQERLYDYEAGKHFISIHSGSQKVYDNCVKYLIDLLHI